jgi:hypothetical protein
MVGIARGRSRASMLVIPRRKTALVEAFHGGAAMVELKLHGRPWELRPEREGRGKGRERGGCLGVPLHGWGAMGGSATRALVAAPCSVRSLAARVRNKTAGRKEKRRERKEKKKGRKKEK